MTEVGVLYSLFCTDEGEVFSGGGEWDIDEFADFIADETAMAIKNLLSSNPHKMITLVINAEPSKGLEGAITL